MRLAVGAGQPGRGDRHERLLLQLGPVQVVDDPQGSQVERAGDVVDVLGLQVELAGEQGPDLVGHRRVDLEAHRPPEPPAPQLHLHRLEQVVGLLLLEGQVGVAGDPERVVALDVHPREQRPEVGGDHLLEGHEALAVRHAPATRAAPAAPSPGRSGARPPTGSRTMTARLSDRLEM